MVELVDRTRQRITNLVYGGEKYGVKVVASPPPKTLDSQHFPPRVIGWCLWLYSYLSYKRTSNLESAHQVTWESVAFMKKLQEIEFGPKLNI